MAAGEVGAAIGSLGGAVIGEMGARSERRSARKARERALSILEGLDLPDIEKMRILAEMEQAEQLGPSAMEGVTPDEQAVADERAVLARLQGLTESGGLDMQGRARLAEIQDQTGQMNRSRQEGVLANLRDRGQLGGGMELSARMSAAGEAANAANRGGMQTAADAERRYLESLSMRGDLSGRMRRDSFSEGAARANARDAIAKFNAMNRQDVGMRNTNRQNEAQYYNSGLYQQDFDNRFRRAAGQSNALTGHASALENSADRTANRWSGYGQAGGAAAGYGYDLYQENKKKKPEGGA